MKQSLFVILLLIPFFIFGQRKTSQFSSASLWSSGGIMPLEKGASFYGKTHLNIFDNCGINFQFGYGFSNPKNTNDRVANVNTQCSFISAGLFSKTLDTKHGKQRKLNLYLTWSIVLGQGKESANYYFEGNDFNNYTSQDRYSQKYDFGYLQTSINATYKIKEKWNIEFGIYANVGRQKNRLGTQYFKIPNYAYAYYNGIIGGNIGIGYLLWKSKSKK